MQRPNPETVTLNDILITEELWRRTPRSPNWQAEAEAMRSLGRQMAQASETLMQTLVDTAQELCQAGTTGVSLLETTPDGEEIFRWTVLAGTLAHHVGETTPRNFSPCGVCFDQGSPILFSHPERYFTYFQEENTPIVEGLVLPLITDSHVLGTIWIMSHDEGRQFDSEDVRVMTSLADFTATALLLKQRQTGELLATNATLETEIVERKQAEEQTHALISSLPGGAVFVVDRNLRYLLAEGEALAIAGFKPEDFVGRTIFEVLPPELAASYEPMYRQALASEPFEHEHHAHGHTYISRGTPLRSEGGEIYAVLVVSYDITERKRVEDERKQAEQALRESEAKLALELADARQLQFISSQLIQEENIDALYEQILEAAIALMRSDMGSMQMLHPDCNELQLLAWKGFDPTLVAFWQWVRVDSDSTCGVALRTGERAIVPDVETCEFMAGSGDLDSYRRSSVRAVQTTPLICRKGRVVGMISTHWQEPHQPSERELGLLDVLARQAADLIEQRQAEGVLRESEAKYRTLFDSIDEGLAIVEMIYDDQGEIVDIIYRQVNRAYERHGGVYNVVGRSIFDVIPGVEDYWLDLYKRVARTGESVREENYQQDVDRWFDVYFSRIGDNGRFVAIVFSDITDRKRREAILRENEERQSFLLKLGDILQQFMQPNDIKTAAMHLLGEHLGVSRAQYHECDSSGEYYSADGVGYANGLPLLDLKYRIDAFGTFVNEDFAAGRPYRIDDLEVSPRVSAAEREAYRSYQIRAGAGVPLIRGGKLVAILAIHDVHPHPWTDFEIELIRETAERIWTPLERARAQDALRESEAKYRSLFTSIDEGFTLLEMIPDESGHAADFRIVETNPAWEQQTGLTDATGKTLLEVVPNFEQHWLDFYSDVVMSGRGRRNEYYTASVDRWYTVYASRIGGEGSRQLAVVFNDISDRKRRERQQEFLLNFSDYLRTLADEKTIEENSLRLLAEFLRLDRAYIFVLYESEDRAVVRAEYRKNNLASLLGEVRMSDFPETVRQIEEQTLVINDIDSDATLSDLNRTSLAAVDLQAFVCANVRKGERNVVWSLAASTTVPRTWTKDEVELIETVAERMWAAVERAKAEKALRELELQRMREQAAREQERQRAESLAELDRAKTTFFSNISHEFRTPLTLSLTPLQDALSDRTHPLDPIHRERLELVHRNSLRLLKLVNTLLDFSRIEAGRMEAVYEPTDLAAYTAELASVFRSAIERAGLQLMVDCPPLPEPVFVDREMWEKIVLNLLSNAFKFTFEGEIRVSLHSTDRHQAILQIQDTGTGIAPEHLPHLFERFYQVRSTQARTHEGSGIGLALVHELVQLQGGTIEVSSTLGEGTCFAIALTFGTDHLPSDRLQSEGDRTQPVRTLASTAMGATAYVEEAERWFPTQNNQEQTIENTEEQATQTADSSRVTPTRPVCL